MLETVTVYREEEFESLTLIIQANGFPVISTPIEQQRHARVYLPGAAATSAQLEAVRNLAALAVPNPVTRFTFKVGTLPCDLWALARELRCRDE
jgi:hypothetical protein